MRHAVRLTPEAIPAGPLEQARATLTVATPAPGFTEFTREAARWLSDIRAGDGLLTAFIRHTSASLVVQENADPDVTADLVAALDRLAPENAGYVHDTEGPDDMPAHIKAMLTGASLAIPVAGGRMRLGTWQGLYVAEHRASPHERQVVLHYLGTINA